MAFLSRLFKRGDPPAEREEARRRGMRDAREHPLGEFTDPEFQPSYVTELRARAREQVTEVDRRLAAARTALLDRALGAREIILRELGRSDTRPEPAAYTNGHSASAPDAAPPDPFISIAEARTRRAEARRRVVVEEANASVQRARARIEHLTQEWESALIERDHEVEAVHARAEQLIAAYKSGVLKAHPRKEEIPSLWKGEVIAVNATGDSPAAISGRQEIGRILREVEDRIEVWHAEVLPRELQRELPRDPHAGRPAELPSGKHHQLSPAPADAEGEPPAPTPLTSEDALDTALDAEDALDAEEELDARDAPADRDAQDVLDVEDVREVPHGRAAWRTGEDPDDLRNTDVPGTTTASDRRRTGSDAPGARTATSERDAPSEWEPWRDRQEGD
ncbi:hypothetical protein GCM10022419_008620 [Nonomuraea rosea]|uniref:Uncharacterized protein n=1 Tax=Nonomuraea rosea TaxID=638574 RepID=A0ABP6VE02_9ACTN